MSGKILFCLLIAFVNCDPIKISDDIGELRDAIGPVVLLNKFKILGSGGNISPMEYLAMEIRSALNYQTDEMSGIFSNLAKVKQLLNTL